MDRIDGPVTVDSDGGQNELRMDVSSLIDGSFSSKSFSFRLNSTASRQCYLRIRTVGTWQDAFNVYINELTMVKPNALYAGGPFASVFAGKTAAVIGDTWTITNTNDYGSQWQTWLWRAFNLNTRGLLFPSSDISGEVTILDSLIA